MGTVELRAFAGARAALGWSHRTLAVDDAATVAEVIARLRAESPAAAPVLERCAVLLDGRRVSAPHAAQVRGSRLIDLLPPFAGG